MASAEISGCSPSRWESSLRCGGPVKKPPLANTLLAMAGSPCSKSRKCNGMLSVPSVAINDFCRSVVIVLSRYSFGCSACLSGFVLKLKVLSLEYSDSNKSGVI
ncbi:hypothetical protein D3C81_1651420 [compost metagenome]